MIVLTKTRLEAGLSRKYLAIKADVHVQTINKHEIGFYAQYQTLVAKRLADALGVGLHELFIIENETWVDKIVVST